MATPYSMLPKSFTPFYFSQLLVSNVFAGFMVHFPYWNMFSNSRDLSLFFIPVPIIDT